MTDEMTVDSPAIDEKSAQTENTKDKNEVPRRDCLPQTIQTLLYNPPLLPHENEDQFFALFESFRNYAKPENIIDYHLVYMATVCRWEADRYRFMAIAVTTNQQQAGLASLFEQTSEMGQVWLRAAPELGDRGWGKQVHPTYSQFVQNNGDWTLLPKFLLEFVRIKIQLDVAE